MARILFVDDDSTTLLMLTKIAELSGHVPYTAGSGQETLEVVGEMVPDIIFLDMNLADTDGLSLLSQLRSQPATANTPIIILSAATELDVNERVQAAGGQAFLTKPISMPTLVDMIQELTDG